MTPATDPEATTDVEASTDESETTVADDADEASTRVKFHAVGGAFHATTFATEYEYGYTILGPSVSYQYFVGRQWGFALRGELYFPLSGRYAGGNIDERRGLRDPYDLRRIGMDGMLMVAFRHEISNRLVLMAGGGLHVQSLKLQGSKTIAIDLISGGVGFMGRLDYRISDVVSIGTDLAFALDPIDFIRHLNRAVITVPVSAGISLGLTFD